MALNGAVQPGATLPADWVGGVYRPALIAGMVTCVAAGWVLLVEQVFAGWHGGYVIPLVALATLETLVAERQFRKAPFSFEWRFPVRLAELGLMLVLLKPLSYMFRGWEAFWTDAGRWILDPLSFLDMNYGVGAFVLVVVWPLALEISGALAALDDRDPVERGLGMDALKSNLVLGAYVLLASVGLRHVASTVALFRFTTQVTDVGTWLPLAYFGMGLLLLGQARLALLRASWAYEQVEADPRLGRRWAGWGVALVAAVTLLALLLPAGDTALGFAALTWVMAVLFYVGRILILFLLLLLSAVLAPCLTLFRLSQPTGLTAPEPPVFPDTLQAPAVPPELTFLRLALFWGVALLVLTWLLVTYLHDRGAFARWPVWRGLVAWWQRVWAWLYGQRLHFHLPVYRRRGAVEVESSHIHWWQRWRAQTAQERVRRLYLMLLQRAAQAGYPRPPSQTPLEYSTQLETHLDTQEQEGLEVLTGAFIQARYSRKAFDPREVSALHRLWERLRAALRSLRNG